MTASERNVADLLIKFVERHIQTIDAKLVGKSVTDPTTAFDRGRREAYVEVKTRIDDIKAALR